MSLENYNLFLAKGRSLELAQAHVAARRAADEARVAHAKRTAGPEAVPYGSDFSYYGVVCKTPPDPKLWRPAPIKNQCLKHEAESYTPNLRTKEGKALNEEIGRTASPSHGFHKVFSRPGKDCFSAAIGYGQYISGMTLWTAQVAHLGDDLIIFVPKLGPEIVPEDAEPIPLSRYYSMQEALTKKAG